MKKAGFQNTFSGVLHLSLCESMQSTDQRGTNTLASLQSLSQLRQLKQILIHATDLHFYSRGVDPQNLPNSLVGSTGPARRHCVTPNAFTENIFQCLFTNLGNLCNSCLLLLLLVYNINIITTTTTTATSTINAWLQRRITSKRSCKLHGSSSSFLAIYCYYFG